MLMKMQTYLKVQKGFTLIELMVVIAILGILAAMVLPKLSGANEAAKNGRLVADLRTVDGAMNMYYSQNLTYNIASLDTLKTAGFLNSVPSNIVFTSGDAQGYVITGTKADGHTTIKSPGSTGFDPATDK